MGAWHTYSAQQAIAELETDRTRGLTQAEAERRLEGGAFARISNAELINLDRVRAFDLRLTGTIVVRFADGSITYAARRYVAALKKRLGIGGEKK